MSRDLQLTSQILDLLNAREETLAVAESLTAGLLASTIVDLPKISGAFRGGLVVYATDLKAVLADVPRDLLDERGPVDPDVAVALAEGTRGKCHADWGLSTTGVAGPDPQDGVPVGTVYVGIAGPKGVEARELHLSGGRADIRARAVTAALELLVEHLREA